MKKCILEIKDEVNIKWHNLDPETRRKLSNKLKFFIPHAKYTPAYKLGRWDGTISYCDIGGRSYFNLLDRMLPIVQAQGYEIDIVDNRDEYDFCFDKIDKDSYSHIAWPKGHALEGEPITLREPQVDSVNMFIDNIQSVTVAPTATGKTIITAILSHKVEKYGRSVVIVPSKDLVTQTEEDYINFGLDVGVYFGDRKEVGRTHTICTWQSLDVLVKNTKANKGDYTIDQFVDGVVAVIVDETHKASGDSLRNLLAGPFSKCPIRWGLTGTLPEQEHDKVALESCVGVCGGKIKAKDLQDLGYLAKCHIDVWQLNDGAYNFSNYQSELKWLTTDDTRLKFIAQAIQLIAEENGNCLVLLDRIESGKKLEELIEGSIFIHGNIKSTDRKKEYKSIQDVDNKVIIATFGVASTGISISRIFNLFLFEPGKSFVRVIQSIGRGLRVAKDKEHINIYDLTSTCKFSKRHLGKRKKFYNEYEYPYKVTKVNY